MRLEKEWRDLHEDFINGFASIQDIYSVAIETILEKLEINILNNEDDWSRNPQSAFELFKNTL